MFFLCSKLEQAICQIGESGNHWFRLYASLDGPAGAIRGKMNIRHRPGVDSRITS